MSSKAFNEKKIGNAVFLKLSGDSETDLELMRGARVEAWIGEGFPKIVFDLEQVQVLFSVAINRLIESLKAARDKGGEIYLVSVPERVRAVLSGIRLDSRLKIYRSEYDFILDHNLMTPAEPGRSMPAEPTEILSFEIRREVRGSEHWYLILGALIEDYHVSELYDRVRMSLEEGAKGIIVDLEKTSFIDSLNVGVFMKIRKLCQERGATLKLVRPNRLVAEVFQLTGIAGLIDLPTQAN